MKIYLDNCALGRLFDDQTQPRIRAEADAVRAILRSVVTEGHIWLASETLREEISRNTDTVRRSDTLRLLRFASGSLALTPSVLARARALEDLGFKGYDARHIAFAESANADVMLTMDVRLLRRADRCFRGGQLTVQAANPVDWLRKVSHGEHRSHDR